MRIRALPAALAALFVLSACDDTLAPQPIGRFVLTSMNGQPAPFVWLDHTFSSGERRVYSILADTLLLGASGQFERNGAHVVLMYQVNGRLPEQGFSASSMTGTQRREGDRVILEYVTVHSYPGSQLDTLVFRNDGLEQTKRLGIYCQYDVCPPPRDFLLRYERR